MVYLIDAHYNIHVTDKGNDQSGIEFYADSAVDFQA